MTGSPAFSVIIPTYNRAASIGDAIASVLGQTMAAAQIIVVDDGSTDDTQAVLARFGASIETVRQANGGVAAARNAGCARATADWLTFLDSDDLWEPERLAVAARDLSSAGPSVVAHVADIALTGPTFETTLFRERAMAPPPGQGEPASDPLAAAIPGLSCIPAAIARRAFEKVGGFDPSLAIYEDLLLFCELALDGDVLLCGDVVARGQRLAGDTAMLTGLERRRPQLARTCLVNAYSALLERDLSNGQRLQLERALSGALHSLAEAEWPADRARALRFLARAAATHPSRVKGTCKSLLPLVLGRTGFRAARRRRGTAIDRS